MSKTTPLLQTVKRYLGIPAEVDSFDDQLLTLMQSTVASLDEVMGYSSSTTVTNETTISDIYPWSSNSVDRRASANIDTYISLKVKMLFDPPVSSVAAKAIQDELSELEWRIYVWYQQNKGNGYYKREE